MTLLYSHAHHSQSSFASAGPMLTLSLPKSCNLQSGQSTGVLNVADARPNDIYDFLLAVVTSEIAQILSLHGGGFLALEWKS